MSRSTILLMRGIVGILVGLAAFAWPGLTLLVLVAMFAAYALLDGITTLWLGLTSTPTEQRVWSSSLQGLLGIAVAIFTFIWPGLTLLALLVIVAAWAVATGILEIVASIAFRRVVADEWLLALSGIISILFGAVLLALPQVGLIGIAWALGAYAMASGIVLTALGVRLRTRAVIAQA